MNFPIRHISIRVPWHDAGWNVSVCKNPSHNTSCIKLVNMAEKKKENAEEKLKGKFISELQQRDYPPCVSEGGTFMATFAYTRFHEHPYVKTSPDTHSRFQ